MIFESKVLEAKAREAAKFYYSSFETEASVTVGEAAARQGITKTELHYYMAHHPDIGMPDNKEEAEKYISALEKITSS